MEPVSFRFVYVSSMRWARKMVNIGKRGFSSAVPAVSILGLGNVLSLVPLCDGLELLRHHVYEASGVILLISSVAMI